MKSHLKSHCVLSAWHFSVMVFLGCTKKGSHKHTAEEHHNKSSKTLNNNKKKNQNPHTLSHCDAIETDKKDHVCRIIKSRLLDPNELDRVCVCGSMYAVLFQVDGAGTRSQRPATLGPLIYVRLCPQMSSAVRNRRSARATRDRATMNVI